MERSTKDSEKRADSRRYSPTEKAVVDRLGSIPRVRPRLSFRLKVNVHVFIVSLFNPSRVRGKAGNSHPRTASYLKYAACLGLTLLLATSLFLGFNVLARDTKPGDTLYFMKRVGERVDLAFTLSDASKAKKNVTFAERRLSELEQIISRDEIEATEVAYLTGEYEVNRRAASNFLQGLEPESRNELTSELEELEQRQTMLARRIEETAGAGGVLEPAAGAYVSIEDVSGANTLDGRSSVTGKADSEGRFEFDIRVEDARNLDSLEAVVRLDGRKQCMPLLAQDGRGRTKDGTYSLNVNPVASMVNEGVGAVFTLGLQATGSDDVSDQVLRIKDVTGDSTIDGKRKSATVKTDSSGRCDFEIEKGSADQVSRIEVEIRKDGGWVSFGEVLAVGTLEFDQGNGRPPASANDGFEVAFSPDLERLDEGISEIIVTVRKKYARLTDFIR